MHYKTEFIGVQVHRSWRIAKRGGDEMGRRAGRRQACRKEEEEEAVIHGKQLEVWCGLL